MTFTVYLSSTLQDLGAEREAVRQALSDECVVKHSYLASENALVEGCLADVAGCDLYIGILGLRYGYVPQGELNNRRGLSITELEYQHAVANGIPRLLFIKHEDAIPYAQTDAKTRQHPMERVEDFRKRAGAGKDQRPAAFATPEELKLAVVKAFNAFKDERARKDGASSRSGVRATRFHPRPVSRLGTH